MTAIIGIAGSLRAGSFNAALLRAAAERMPDGASLDVTTIHGIPLYDADVEARDGIPEPVAALKDRMAAADGLLLATPEYNNGIPGVFKNAVDWLSRPPDDIPRVFHDRPVALLGATPGGMGTALAQAAWLPVLRTLRMRPWFGGRLQLSRAQTLFTEDGSLADEEAGKRLAEFLHGFVAFVRG